MRQRTPPSEIILFWSHVTRVFQGLSLSSLRRPLPPLFAPATQATLSLSLRRAGRREPWKRGWNAAWLRDHFAKRDFKKSPPFRKSAMKLWIIQCCPCLSHARSRHFAWHLLWISTTRLFTVLYFSVRSSRSSALCYGLPSCMSVKTT